MNPVPYRPAKWMELIRSSMRIKLMLGFLIIICLSSAALIWTGLSIIRVRVIQQAQNAVNRDLNAARMIYDGQTDRIRDLIRLTAGRFFIREAFGPIGSSFKEEFNRIMIQERLDFLTMTDARGIVLYRAGSPGSSGDPFETAPLHAALRTLMPVVSTERVPADWLVRENGSLAERAEIRPVDTPYAKSHSRDVSCSGLVMVAAAPVSDEQGRLLGLLYGGRLLNRDEQIVDTITSTLFPRMEGDFDTGTATIFMHDIRIATTVRQTTGERAIGTRVSSRVYDQVLTGGQRWHERAFVVNDWYLTAYEPIRDLTGDIVGMLYVGLPEAPFRILMRRMLFIYLGIAFLGIAGSVFLSGRISGNIISRIRPLVLALDKIGDGCLDVQFESRDSDEIGMLYQGFNAMVRSLQEKRAMREQFASMVSHELKTPLSAVQYNLKVIHSGMTGKISAKTAAMLSKLIGRVENLNRLLNDWLRLSRIEADAFNANLKPLDPVPVLESVVADMKNHPASLNISWHLSISDPCPKIWADENGLTVILNNVIGNAVKYNRDGGSVYIRVRTLEDHVRIMVRDTGIGIPGDKLPYIFDKFYRIHDGAGIEGSGLGLCFVKIIMEQHQAKIGVDSKPGEGTTFSLCFRRFKETG
ncbi:cache domain-containing protein [bacterium]|nr:cache domain-containing protein [bacterium]